MQQPVVVCVDDLQWFGHGMLRPLDDEAVALLIGDVLGAVPEQSVLASAARAEEQPLLLVELLRG
jgi:hypothetical protein